MPLPPKRVIRFRWSEPPPAVNDTNVFHALRCGQIARPDFRRSTHSPDRFGPNGSTTRCGGASSHPRPHHRDRASRPATAPRFICTQRTKRSEDETGKGRRWNQSDILEIELSFVSHRPSWKLLRRDGKPAVSFAITSEPTSFSDAILQFFLLPSALRRAEVTTALGWNRWKTLYGRRGGLRLMITLSLKLSCDQEHMVHLK